MGYPGEGPRLNRVVCNSAGRPGERSGRSRGAERGGGRDPSPHHAEVGKVEEEEAARRELGEGQGEDGDDEVDDDGDEGRDGEGGINADFFINMTSRSEAADFAAHYLQAASLAATLLPAAGFSLREGASCCARKGQRKQRERDRRCKARFSSRHRLRAGA
eukprot:3341714-Pleurochrysis_carterae.AAC.1